MNTQEAVKEPGRPVEHQGLRERPTAGSPRIERRENGSGSDSTSARWQVAIFLIAPSLMAGGLFYHPAIGNPTDADFLANLAAAVRADTFRWALAHHMVAIGSGLIALAFLALENRLREAGENRASRIGFPLIVVGSLMYAMLPAMEFAPFAAAEAGADPSAAQGAIFPWFIPTLFTGALIFFVGAVYFARAIVRSRLLKPGLARIVAGAMVVAAASRLVPVNFIQMDLQAIAGIIALWPLAYVTWNDQWRRMP